LSWDAAKDCDGNAVAGYNIYRSTSPSGMFTRLNRDIIASAEYIDGTARATAAGSSPGVAAAAVPGPIYYYVVTSVDDDGDESIQSAMVSPSPAATDPGGSSSGGGGGCFISTAKRDVNWDIPRMMAVLAVSLVLTIWLRAHGAGRRAKK
jgi:hypothetical protein